MLSIILPAKNEAESLRELLPQLTDMYRGSEIIVVDDGSTDDTRQVCASNSVRCVSHPYSKGNGAAVKSGARAASGDVLVFMDADGQHLPANIQSLLNGLENGYDMVVGQRSGTGQASYGRGLANRFYNWLASVVTGHTVKDLTSGFRAVKAPKFKQFLYLLPNGFSYPTSITMAFFRAGYSIAYEPIDVKRRLGKSHIKPFRDGVRFLLIIFRVTTLYSPLKLFFPASMLFIILGMGYGIYTLFEMHRFTNMSMLLLLAGSLIFFFGLIAEQITMLLYKN